MTYLVITQKMEDGEVPLITFKTFNTVPEVENFCRKQEGLICKVYEVTKGAVANSNGTFKLTPMWENPPEQKSTRWKLVSSDNKYTYSFDTIHPRHRLVDYIYAAQCLNWECDGKLKIKATEEFICGECRMLSKLEKVI